MRDVDVLLDDADEQLKRVRDMYEASLQAKDASGPLQARIKNVLENQRSALDYLATAITNRDGKQGTKPQFPYSFEPEEFDKWFDKAMPGVRAARADIADAFRRHQPFQPGHDWVKDLAALTNENKHRQLTPQSRDETRQIDTRRGGTGAGVVFTPYQPGKGGVSFGGDLVINGVPVDSQTLLPIGGGPKPYIETIYVDWLFADPPKSALRTLEEIAAGIRPAVADIVQTAGL